MHVRVHYRQETINTYNRCGLWDFNEINGVNLAVLTHICIGRIHIRAGKLVKYESGGRRVSYPNFPV
jgi:hypothetical protein